MKRLLILFVVAAMLVCVAAGPASARKSRTHVVTTFSAGDWGAFAEGLAADSQGNLYASLTNWGYASEDYSVMDPNIGEVWKVAPCGAKSLVASLDITAFGMLTGMAVDRDDRVYVGCGDAAPFNGMPSGIGSGVYRVGPGALTKVVALPDASWPNGLAFHDGSLYITDSVLGAVWRVQLGDGVAGPDTPWLQDDLLALDPAGFNIGANGLAFSGRHLYVSVSDFGRIVRVPVRGDGSPGALKVVCETPELSTADGIAFDIAGRLWITVNTGSTGTRPSGALYRLGQDGVLKMIADDPGWLNFPTMPVFGTTWGTSGTLYIENGAYDGWFDGTSPDITALRVGVPGLPLW